MVDDMLDDRQDGGSSRIENCWCEVTSTAAVNAGIRSSYCGMCIIKPDWLRAGLPIRAGFLCPSRLLDWGPHSLPCKGYRELFPRG
jgi:hypothetical protein